MATTRRFSALQRSPRAARLRERAGAGFTLLESLMALVIIGVGILAFVDAQSAFTQSNNWSSQAATGMLLANEVREMTRRLPRHDPVTGLWVSGTGAGAVLNGWGRESGEVAVTDIDDMDDLDGVTFGSGGTFAGPIDAFGAVVPETDLNGGIVLSGGVPVPLTGWRQVVTVTKVDPFNFATTRAPGYSQPATAQLPLMDVDDFPLRITVVVTYTAPGATQPLEVTRVTWIAPP
jgi:prepilin-type N-terminal cleavage/methylation domain-containing protein